MSTSNVPAIAFHPDPNGVRNGFYTTVLFWECECQQDFLHPIDQERCHACGFPRSESPDARLETVLRDGSRVDARLVAIVLKLADIEPIPF
jgi:hypothetical protein